MGMYDTIECLYQLPPIPQKPEELINYNPNEVYFQTKDLDNVLDHYTIRSDGTIWHELYDIEDKSDPNAKGIERLFGMHSKTNDRQEQMSDFSRTINFYEFIAKDEFKFDYWIEYLAVFSSGKLCTITLTKFEATSNDKRKAQRAEFDKKMKERHELWDRWYMKYGYAYYDRAVAYAFKQWNQFIQSDIIPDSYKVERWLRPL